MIYVKSILAGVLALFAVAVCLYLGVFSYFRAMAILRRSTYFYSFHLHLTSPLFLLFAAFAIFAAAFAFEFQRNSSRAK
jgi:hypothetical protein